MTNDERKVLETAFKDLMTLRRGRTGDNLTALSYNRLTKTITLIEQALNMNKIVDEKVRPFNPEFEAGALLGMIKAYSRFTVEFEKIPERQRRSAKSLEKAKLASSTFMTVTKSVQRFVEQIKRDKFQTEL